MRVNKKAILDTIEWAKTALANGMRVPPPRQGKSHDQKHYRNAR